MEIYLSQKNIRINRKILCGLLKHVTTAKHKRVQNAAFSSYAPTVSYTHLDVYKRQ